MSSQGDRLAIVLEGWTRLILRGDQAALTTILDERVTWQGLLPHLVCHGRDEVVGLLGRYGVRPPRLTRLEAEEAGERVAISVEGPDFAENGVLAAAAPRSLVFTFADNKIVRMESFASRDAAFASLRQGE